MIVVASTRTSSWRKRVKQSVIVLLSAATFVAWLTPTPPGVTETVLAIELPPATDMTV